MASFLEDTIHDIFQSYGSFTDMVFILPNKRSGLYLKKCIANYLEKPIFSPSVHSVEELITSISGLEKVSSLQLMFELYKAQTFQPKTDPKAFDIFSNWAITLLSDFNDIDSYLVDQRALFGYLTATKRIQSWELKGTAPTQLISENLKFWESLASTYDNLKHNFAKKRIGYQGHIYKDALQNLENYLQQQKDQHYFFIGFNALTGVEQKIVQYFLLHAKATIYWDIDTDLLNDTIHEAGYFIRKYIEQWPYFRNKSPKGISNHLISEKRINIVGIPKQVAQTNYIGELLEIIYRENHNENVALILPDEHLLPAMLNAIPQQINRVNITMGLPLKASGLYRLFNAFIDLHLNTSQNGWHYKQVLDIFSSPFVSLLLRTTSEDGASVLRTYIKKGNVIYIKKSDIDQLVEDPLEVLNTFFPDYSYSNSGFVEACLHLVKALDKATSESPENLFELQALSSFYNIFHQLNQLLNENQYVKGLKSLKTIYTELVKTEKIHFRGEPLGGLQIMGMLESRNLDFDTVIIASVNEGVLPAGKTQRSHIPHDIKKEYNLPSYKEKDAVFAYHFYRLLQRSKTIHITYNTEADVLFGNEPSRFIAQLLTDPTLARFVRHKLATPSISIPKESPLQVHKSPLLVTNLKAVAAKGLSPTSLSDYIRNPYSFYQKHVLHLNDLTMVEENIAHNTFGTIVHDTLEELYLPFVGKTLYADMLAPLKHQLPLVVRKRFKAFYTDKGIDTGKNHIAYQVILRYLESFLAFDSNRVKTHTITLRAVEEKRITTLNVPGLGHDVVLKGKIDRIEEVDGKIQILDYKTGRVSLQELQIEPLSEVFTEKRTKAFQLLCYALLLGEAKLATPIHAGIVPLKQLTQGILFFNLKSNRAAKAIGTPIDKAQIEQFELLLAQLVEEIFNPNIPFEDTGQLL
ncbi:MAG: PD-(D/E)XK nuclease family protein [Bacteroidota bacterium]